MHKDYLKNFYKYSVDDFTEFHKKAYPHAHNRTHKSFNESERNLYNDWWQEQIFQFGTEVDYYASQYSLSGHDSLYGEEPTRSYAESVKLVVAFELNESAIVLNKFGLVGDDEITGYIAIDTFYNQLSSKLFSPEKPSK